MFLNDNLKIFSGSSNPALAGDVCKYLGIPLGGAKIGMFPDGEKVIRVEDDVRGRDCFVVQSTCEPVDEHLVGPVPAGSQRLFRTSAMPARTEKTRGGCQ